jgi:hypothetical protein
VVDAAGCPCAQIGDAESFPWKATLNLARESFAIREGAFPGGRLEEVTDLHYGKRTGSEQAESQAPGNKIKLLRAFTRTWFTLLTGG